jgi:group I intron endonuclease
MVTNLINGKKYIGMDSNNNPKYLGSGTLITQSLKKYGRKNFKKEILEYCSSIEEMEVRETYWISKFNALKDPLFYNLEDNRKRGTNPFQNKTEEEKQIIYKKRGDKQKGIPKIGNKKPKPEGFAEAQKERFKGRGNWRSQESKLKQSISLKGKGTKPITQYDKQGNYIKCFQSITEACLDLNKPNRQGDITACCQGKQKTAFGYIWKYKE